MSKINHGVDLNNIALRKAAIELGDQWVPDTDKRRKLQSTSWLTSYLLIIIGTLMLFYEILPFISGLFIN